MAQALLKAVLSGEYQQGVQLFEALKRPAAQDFRWGGVCHLHLGDMLKARRLLLMAVTKGDQAARVELATCLRFEGEFAAARAQLSALDVDQMTARDAALALREAAILEQQCGEITRAAALLDEAWSHAVSAALLVQSAVAQSIALVAAHQGNDVKAEAYLRFTEEHANAMRRVYVLLARAASATYLGKFKDAQQALSAAEKHVTSCPLAAALLPYRWGMWFSAQGQWHRAREGFERAVHLAREQQQPETEFYAQLGLTAVATATGDETAERGSLARAKALIKTPRAQAYLDWRQGAALIRQGDPHGFKQLNAALDYFRASGCTREVVWVLLHLTEAHALLGSPKAAREAIREAADAHVMLGGQQHLSLELNGLARTRQLLDTLAAHDYERVLCAPPTPALPVAQVSLVTLGSPAILINGQRVRLQMKKFVEVLAFLLKKGETTLGTLQMEVSGGVPPGRSKNYIHQVRHELKRLVPGLSVPYDPTTQTYRVRCEGVHLTWDWQQAQDALLSSERDVMLTANLNVRNFLQDSDSEWVGTERERMSRWIVRIGLETMDAWYSAGDYAKCVKLAERLIEIDPLDEGLHDFLIRATAQVSGVGAARTICWESRTLFAREVGHVPHLLDVLAQRLQHQQPN
ncbi:BTAD domain-containing putative transcriptional regulator [Deinococcus frigens]|uniref:BTAD domain-containing putative transcriptional regulator n=1 Tax=Deinococcus frigens TaxID=249403 RepID=UPI0004977AA8|nr:BTAD domain-containing putative transcriptional regulator [Deinococcus frigens]